MSSEKLVLKSSDGETFEVDQSVMFMSEFIRNKIQDGVRETIPLPNISSKILVKVIEYCNRFSNVHNGGGSSKKRKKIILAGEADVDKKKRKAKRHEDERWEAKYLDVDPQTLWDLINAANHLNIAGLLDMGSEKIASMIRGKTVEQIREAFNIQSDFTPEEEEEIRNQAPWAFQY